MLRQLNEALLAIMLTNQPPATTDHSVTPPPFNAEGGSTGMWPAPALYNDDVHMGEVEDLVTNDCCDNC